MYEDYRYYLSALLSRLPLLIGVFLLVSSIGIIAALKLPPVYRSTAIILVESQQIPDDLVRSTVTSLPDERIAIIEQRIMTRDNLLRVAEKFDLYKEERQKLSISEVIAFMRKSASIESIPLVQTRRRRDASTISFAVAFEHGDPSVAAQVANELVTLVLEENVRSRTRRAEETERFLEREVERIRVQLSGMEGEIAEFKRQNSASLPENLAFKINAVERLRESLSELDQEARTLSEERRLLELGLAEDGSPAATQDPVEQRYEQLRAQLVAKSATFSDSHPEIRWLKRELENVEQQLERQAASVADQTNTDPADPDTDPSNTATAPTSLATFRIAVFDRRLELIRAEKEAREARVVGLEDDIARTAQVELALQALTRNYESAKGEHQELLAKLADAKIGKTLEEDRQAERFEVVEQASEPSQPIRPNRRKIAALGLLLAGAASGGLFAGLETINMRLRGSGHLSNIVGHRPIVAIPVIRTKRDRNRRRTAVLSIVVILALAIGAILAAIHFWYMPLDLLLIIVQEKTQILLFRSGAG